MSSTGDLPTVHAASEGRGRTLSRRVKLRGKLLLTIVPVVTGAVLALGSFPSRGRSLKRT